MYLPLPASHLLIHLERGPGKGGGGRPPPLRPPTENSPWTLLPPFGSPLEKNVWICTCLLLQFLCIPALHLSSCSQLLCNTVNSQKNA